jgi:hypothetical protein
MRFTHSRAIRHLVELGLANDILNNHIKVIVEALVQVLKQETRRNLKPHRNNSYRSAFYAAQCRSLITNTLSFLVDRLGEDPDTTQRIFRQSEEEARDVRRR